MELSAIELLEKVVDQDSFLRFVRALADEREMAEQMEREEPARYQLGGALRWQCADISAYLYGCLDYFDEKPLRKPEAIPSWKMFADFLYVGKIIE